ncbi:ATP-dependent Clp protease proteolytic subunit [Kordiimonas marina]|uniref:ATP-dependent Clp protease proteolytic subunit n=1 Tax=Kordiimonas marina TaxID=2872312 RepID=UPI001FF27031|nr:ATP-dependent Clp protease proteolytic subunit [Kordiimonas marina]
MMDEEERAEEKSKPASDLVDEKLFANRTVLIYGQINDKLARTVCAQLLALDSESNDPIRVIISSPGGHVESGDSIHDIIRFIRSEVTIIGSGWVASAGTHIYLAVPKERRLSLPNTRFLIHQPSGAAGGQSTDIAIQAEQIIRMRERLAQHIAKATGQDVERVRKDIDRDFWLDTEGAIDYGIVGRVIETMDDLDRKK